MSVARHRDTARGPRRAFLFASLRDWTPAWISGDLAAGVTLAAIAIPEQMATARLAGLPLASGFYAFLAGTVAFFVFGTNRWISVGADSTIAPIFGATISTLIAGVATSSASAAGGDAALALAAVVAVIVGALLVIAALARLGWLADLLSVPVTTGFLAGISLRIIIGQLPDLLGITKPRGVPWREVAGIVREVPDANVYTLVLGGGVFAIVFAGSRISHKLPAALIALVLACIAVPVFGLGAHGVDTVGAVATGLPRPSWPHASAAQWAELVKVSALVALVCIMQTSAVARSFPPGDGSEPRIGHDLGAVGAGSLLAGLFGAFAVNASPPRTALVKGAGGRSQIAGLVAAAAVLVLVAAGSSVLAYVPHAALAGVLVYIATHIFRVGEMRRIARGAPAELALLAATTIAILALPIATAITIGIVLSLAHGLYLVSRPAAGPLYREPGTTIWWSPEPNRARESDPRVLVFAFEGPLLFTSAHYFRDRLDQVLAAKPAPRLLVLEATGITDIDYTGGRILRETIAHVRDRGITVALARLESPRAERAARKQGIFALLGERGVYKSVAEAVAAFESLLTKPS